MGLRAGGHLGRGGVTSVRTGPWFRLRRRVTTCRGQVGSVTAQLRVEVLAPPVPPAFPEYACGPVLAQPVNRRFAHAVVSRSGTGPLDYSCSPPLPPGIRIHPATGEISGRPRCPAVLDLTVRPPPPLSLSPALSTFFCRFGKDSVLGYGRGVNLILARMAFRACLCRLGCRSGPACADSDVVLGLLVPTRMAFWACFIAVIDGDGERGPIRSARVTRA